MAVHNMIVSLILKTNTRNGERVQYEDVCPGIHTLTHTHTHLLRCVSVTEALVSTDALCLPALRMTCPPCVRVHGILASGAE